MAVLWQKSYRGSHYEVRSAGNTKRLYTNGVFHSHYNPTHITSQGVWDLLVLPALLYPAEKIQRVLLLGVGGGAVIHQLNQFVHPAHITGVELDAIHLQVAKRFFKLNYANTQLINDDAIQWLRDYDGEPFDLIIDDLYGEEMGEPIRAVTADRQWLNTMLKHTTKDGMLVMNFISEEAFYDCAFFDKISVKKRIASAFKLTTRYYQNHVLAMSKEHLTSNMLTRNRAAHRPLASSKFGDSFWIRKLRQ